MWKIVALVGLALAGAAAIAQEDAEPPRRALLLALHDEAITPVTAGWVERAIDRAEDEGAACLVVVLDTPGGLVDSTRTVVKAMLRARVPVVVFVPPGGRAASAGVFVTLAAHVAAMAPGSNIGAAHPVRVGGLPIAPPEPAEGGPPGPEEPDRARPLAVVEEKAVNDTTAWARSLAELRGRNADWAASAVRESRSVTAEEAQREGVVDLLARDVAELLAIVDGREVELMQGPVVLRTAGALVAEIEAWWGQRLLAVLCRPNVAFLLVVFGFYGVLFELYSPGWGVAGTLGAVALVLGLFGLSFLPLNYVAVLLIAVALGMFVAEVFVTSYGVLALGGLACLVLGGTMLVDSPEGFLRISLRVVLPVAAATAAITVMLVGGIVRAHRSRVLTGAEGLLGEGAVAREEFEQDGARYAGTVWTRGEYWKAASTGPVKPGERLRVRDREGMTLIVEALER